MPHTHFRPSSLINMHMLVYTGAHTAYTLALFHIFPAFLSSCISKVFPKQKLVLRADHSTTSARLALDMKSLDSLASVSSHFSKVELWQHKYAHSADGQTEHFTVLDSVLWPSLNQICTQSTKTHYFIFVWNVINDPSFFSHSIVYWKVNFNIGFEIFFRHWTFHVLNKKEPIVLIFPLIRKTALKSS